jgi:integrase
LKKQKLPPGLYQLHGAWHFRFYQRELLPGGNVRQRRPSQKLASLVECPTLSSVLTRYHEAAARAGKQQRRPTSNMTLSEFWRVNYLPWIQASKKPSTVKGYKQVWGQQLESSVGSIALRDFRKRDAIAALEPLAFESKFAAATIHHARTLLGSMFRRACELELTEHNPIRDFKTPQGKPTTKGEAYTSEEMEAIILVLTGRAKVIAALFAYTGIRPSELCGLQWPDYEGHFLHIRRGVWNGKVTTPKTEESAAIIPVIAPLREILDDWKSKTAGIFWLVCGDTGNPIRLNNVARREVVPVLKANGIPWKSWYGFRRGASTTMSDDMNLTEDQVRVVLRHADGSDTARQHYIVRELKKRQTVMDQYEQHVSKVREELSKTTHPVV